jgi:hypothetical protein
MTISIPTTLCECRDASVVFVRQDLNLDELCLPCIPEEEPELIVDLTISLCPCPVIEEPIVEVISQVRKKIIIDCFANLIDQMSKVKLCITKPVCH